MSREFAGLLTERIHIERQAPQRNAMGLQQDAWEGVCSCLASIEIESIGPEREAMSLSAMPRFRLTVRQRNDLELDQRVNWKGRVLMVRQIVQDPRAKDRVTLRCEEVRR